MVGALERLRVGDGAHPLVRRLVRDCARPLATDGAVQPTILCSKKKDVSPQIKAKQSAKPLDRKKKNLAACLPYDGHLFFCAFSIDLLR